MPAIGAGDAWARVLRAPGVPTVLRTLLTYLRPVVVDVDAGRIVLTGTAMHVESARGRHGQIVECCRRELGRAFDVVLEAEQEAPAVDTEVGEAGEPEAVEHGDETPLDAEQAAPPPPPARGPMTVPSQHPLVKEAMKLFGARIVDVQQRRPTA